MSLAAWPKVLVGALKIPTLYNTPPRSAVPPNKTVTYGRFVVDVRPNTE
jgi:hypothetical protein